MFFFFRDFICVIYTILKYLIIFENECSFRLKEVGNCAIHTLDKIKKLCQTVKGCEI